MDLIEALKVAYCYMPEEQDITEEQYGESFEVVRQEVSLVRSALISKGIDPDLVYDEMNPPINVELSPKLQKLLKIVNKQDR